MGSMGEAARSSQLERAHHLIDTLPESEVGTAVRVLAALAATANAPDDPVGRALDTAPDDDEEETKSESGRQLQRRESKRPFPTPRRGDNCSASKLGPS